MFTGATKRPSFFTSLSVMCNIIPGTATVVVVAVVAIGVNNSCCCAAKGRHRKSKATSFLVFINSSPAIDPPLIDYMIDSVYLAVFSYLVPGVFCQLDQTVEAIAAPSI